MRSQRLAIALVGLAAVWPRTAHADAGVPLLALLWPASWVLFIPICLVEALIAQRLLGLSFASSVKLSVVANAWSTLVGLPLTWLVLCLLELSSAFGLAQLAPDAEPIPILSYTLFAPWMSSNAQRWTAFAAAAFLCLPFMLVSMRVERWSASKKLPLEQARRWALTANLATYAPLFTVLVALAAFWARTPR